MVVPPGMVKAEHGACLQNLQRVRSMMEAIPYKSNESSVSTNSTDSTCPMDYSSEIDDLTSIPFSPVFPDEEGLSSRRNNQSNDLNNLDNADDPCDCKEKENKSPQRIIANHPQFSHYNISESKDSIDVEDRNDIRQTERDDSTNTLTNIHSINMSSVTLVRPLHQSSDCNKRNSNGQSPLSITSSACFLKGMELLIEKGANVNILDAYGRSPLHLACENNSNASPSSLCAPDENYHLHHNCMKLLLAKGANTNIRDAYGRTPLHIAAKVGCIECIRLLLDHGARTDVQDNEGNTALHIAAGVGNLEVMSELSPTCFEDNHSSVEFVSPLPCLDDRDNLNSSYGRISLGQDNGAASFYRSPRQNEVMERRRRSSEMGDIGASFVTTRQEVWNGIDEAETINNSDWFHSNNYAITGRCQSRYDHNDSGYFTAKGSGVAWTKRRSIDRDPIEEEIDSIESCSSVSLQSYQFETESVESSVVSLTDSNFDFVKMEVLATKSFLGQSMDLLFNMLLRLTRSLFGTSQHRLQTDKNGKFIFKEPPKHVAVAMERMKSRNNLD
mmetsp:Transcript_10080/g.21656  ORF Transcript_10080/g.21656 Transcript_10080/m.21656 type:complete len:557 (+) Transcript_10080:67-1737(+)